MTIAYKCDKCGSLIESAVTDEIIYLLNHKIYIQYSKKYDEDPQEQHFCNRCRVDLLKEAIIKLEKEQGIIQ